MELFVQIFGNREKQGDLTKKAGGFALPSAPPRVIELFCNLLIVNMSIFEYVTRCIMGEQILGCGCKFMSLASIKT